MSDKDTEDDRSRATASSCARANGDVIRYDPHRLLLDAPQRPRHCRYRASAWASSRSRPAPPPFPIKKQSTPDTLLDRHRRLGCDALRATGSASPPACPARKGSAAFSPPHRPAAPPSATGRGAVLGLLALGGPRAALATQGAPAYPLPHRRARGRHRRGRHGRHRSSPRYRPAGTLARMHARGAGG